MWTSSRRDRCIRSSLLTAISILCISFIFISLAYRGKDQQVGDRVLNENSILSERLINEKCVPVCGSRECISQANILLKTMKSEVDPCDNVQTFLCGEYEQRLGQDEFGLILIDYTTMAMLHKMKDAIENIDAPPGSAFSKLKVTYDSCVNIGSSDLRGIEDFKQFLKDIGISDWPYLTEDFSFPEDGLPVFLGTLKSYGEAINFVPINIISETMENGNETYVQVSFSKYLIGYGTTFQKDPAFDILKYFDIGSEDIELILNDYGNVKSALWRLREENNTICDEDTCEEKNVHLDCSSPGDEDWVFLCQIVQVFLNLMHPNVTITKPGIFVMENDVFILKKFISTLKALPNRSVANFFALKLLWNHLDEINLFFRLKKQKYYEHFKTDDTSEPYMEIQSRWMYCLGWIKKWLFVPMEKLYVEENIDKSIIDEIHDMHINFTSVIADIIVQQEWIPMEFRYPLGYWVRNLKNSFSENLQKIPSERLLNEYMKLFYPTCTSFFHNAMENRRNILRCIDLYELQLYNPETHRKQFVPSFKVGATYSDAEIVYHYGMILPPYHYPGHNRLINRALFVPIVIHEVGHCISEFLSKTVEMSESENYVNSYLEKKQCMENQFSKFEFKYLGGKLNGTQYFQENLGDNVAQEFFDKMLENFESSEETISLPGLLYSPKQLLYMSAGEGFCSKSSLKMDLHDKNDVHAPMEYRLIGPMQNSRGYAETFNCPPGSYMNPTTKCTLFN